MAIDPKKLFLWPINLQQILRNPNTGEVATDATIYFYKTDRTTPKKIYYWSGDPDNEFVGVNSIELTQGIWPNSKFPSWLYPVDETDNKTEELYYIAVKDSGGTTFQELDQYPRYIFPNPDANDESLANLCPSYGFDVPVWQDFYKSDNNVIEKTNATAWGWLWHKDKPENAYFTYEFEQLPVGTVEGDPDYEITLKCENVTAPQTEHWHAFTLGFAQELVGKDITFNIFTRDKSITAVTQLKAILIREKNGVKQPPTEVATIALATSRQKKNIEFTVPALPAGTFISQDKMYLGFELPFNQAFKIAFTGTFSYEGKNKTYTVLKTALSERFARLRNALPLQFSKTKDWEYAYLPKVDGIGRTDVQNRTGEIFQSGKGEEFNFAVPLHGQVLIRGQKFENTLADRFLNNAASISNLSPNAFDVTKNSSTKCTIKTFVPGKFRSAWTSNSGVVAVNTVTSANAYGISSTIDGANDRLLHITFTEDFAPPQGPIQYKKKGNNFFASGHEPASNVIASWFGDFNQVVPGAQIRFSAYSGITVTTTDAGSSSTQATVDIEFDASGLPPADLIPTNKNYVVFSVDTNIPKNYFAFMSKDIPSSDGNMTRPPAYSFGFSVDNRIVEIPAQKVTIVAAITSAEAGVGSTLASKMNEAINTGEVVDLVFSGVPNNGDWIAGSTLNTDLAIIFYQLNQTKPTNPDPARKPIYVEYDGGATIEQALDACIKTLRNDVGGIPTYDALGLKHNDNLTWYVNY